MRRLSLRPLLHWPSLPEFYSTRPAASTTSARTPPITRKLEVVHDRSIAANRVEVPALQEVQIIQKGTGLYAAMCVNAILRRATIWSIVAFVTKLPGLPAAHYKDMAARAPPDEEME